MNKKIGIIYETDNFEMFKLMNANRGITNARKKTLIESIRKHGYITSPIIVNEKMEVIDGQGRLLACKELNVPIAYTIVEGIGIDECMVLNANMQNWKTLDFIKSYAQQGNADYQRLLTLANMGFNVRVYMWVNGLYGGTGLTHDTINNGNAKCTEYSFEKTVDTLEFIKPLVPCIKAIQGRESEIEKAIAFAYKLDKIDNARLKDIIEKRYSTIEPIANIRHAISEIEKAYNFHLKDNRVYLSMEYDVFCKECGKTANKYCSLKG